MERRYVPDSEQKLVILYALRQLGPVTGMQLLQFLVEKDLMNYIEMQLNLCEMQELGQLRELPHPSGTLLTVTEDGEYALEAFDSRIPASKREQIDADAPTWRALFRAEQQALAESFPLSDGGLCVRLRLLEDDSALADMLITLPETKSIPLLAQRWRQGAQQVYAAITGLLGAGYTDDPDAVLPPAPNVQPVNENEWLLSLTGRNAHMRLTLMLTLPNEQLACHYASRWEEHCEQVMQQVTCLLEDEA